MKILAAAALASIVLVSPATAEVLTFDGTSTAGAITALPSTYQYQGFNISTGFAQYAATSGYRNGGPDNGTTRYLQGFDNSVFTRTDSGLFSVSQLDLALADYTLAADTVTLTGLMSNGSTISSTLALTRAAYGTFSLTGFTGLSRFSISAPNVGSGYFALDNLNYTIGAADPVAPVPEPATWGMMILGFGVVGASMRRRKSNVRATVRFA